MRILCFSLFFLAVAIVFGAAQNAQAQEPVKFQVGKITVWAIADAVADRDMSVFMADQETLQRYVPSGKTPSSVMTFVVQTEGETILIDTGYGREGATPPSLLMPGLTSIGIRPQDISQVLITHMHGDHIGGLIQKGAKAFPKAKIRIASQEYSFWLSEKSRADFPDRKANFDMVKRISDMYEGAISLFDFGESVAPGITALDAVGHTPGHTAFMIESEGKRLLCVSDFLHAAALQFPRPDINARYDMDPDQARVSRERLLKLAADENLPIAGMHLPAPGIGYVRKATEGYAYHPEMKQ